MTSDIENSSRYFKSKPPTFSDGSLFLGYKLPAAQTFTSFSPSTDINAHLEAITGKNGYKQRELLQSKYGTEILSKVSQGQLTDSISKLAFPGYNSRASCQQDTDCGTDQICYIFNDQVFGPQQGPTCSDAVFPEIDLGNKFNNGVPLRQYSNSCKMNKDCEGIDEITGKKKEGMSCNHYYKGPGIYEDTGKCQVHYESKGNRYYLQTPPGWSNPLNENLQKCNKNSDCGPTGIGGWTRCESGSNDGDKYCVWPGQTLKKDGHIPQPSGLPKFK